MAGSLSRSFYRSFADHCPRCFRVCTMVMCSSPYMGSLEVLNDLEKRTTLLRTPYSISYWVQSRSEGCMLRAITPQKGQRYAIHAEGEEMCNSRCKSGPRWRLCALVHGVSTASTSQACPAPITLLHCTEYGVESKRLVTALTCILLNTASLQMRLLASGPVFSHRVLYRSEEIFGLKSLWHVDVLEGRITGHGVFPDETPSCWEYQ